VAAVNHLVSAATPTSTVRTIALEEHYLDPAINEHLHLNGSGLSEKIELLQDYSSVRLRDMGEGGIDIQVLSHAPPGLQRVEVSSAAELARNANDRLAQIVQGNPTRFAAFASLPTALPETAADELERAVTELGFKGAMLHGPTNGRFLDDERFQPILKRAATLAVPIYLHPADPLKTVSDSYFADYEAKFPNFTRAAWGFTIETGTHALRLILSGVFEKYPNLKIIVGHLGEAIPFLLTRIDEALSRDSSDLKFREIFVRHFYVTTSGFFSNAALECCIKEIGVERIMFSVDWPYASNKDAVRWLDKLPLPTTDKAKIRSETAARLLRL
jgi:2,3-dihydroxybenzoate decarboxylase